MPVLRRTRAARLVARLCRSVSPGPARLGCMDLSPVPYRLPPAVPALGTTGQECHRNDHHVADGNGSRHTPRCEEGRSAVPSHSNPDVIHHRLGRIHYRRER